VTDDVTARDRVWAAALDLCETSAWSWTIDQLLTEMDDPPSRKTCQRVLRAMAELGVLRHYDHSPRYERGERFPRR
jgi:hypothetical protein